MTSLWLEASRDIEAENAELVMSKAKMATADIWPFLALARSTNEFEHRLALAEDHLEAAVPHVGTRDQIVASFREDFGIVDSIRAEAADDGDDDADDNGGPSDDDEDDKPWNKKGSVQIFHQASQQWITVEAAEEPTPGNPFNVPVEEEGPETAQTGTYPKHPTGADPYNPINGMFPMQPTPWTDNGVQWVDNPMSFAPYRTASAPYTNEGVQTGTGQNPDYFAGGEEGVAGSQQAGFPVDESIPEPDTRVDFYGGVPPVQSGGSTGPDGTYGKQGAKDNHGACYDCNQPVYRKGRDWLHLQNDGSHPVRLPSDHPWVQARISARREPLQKHDKVYLTQDTHDEEFGDGEGFHAPKGWKGTVNHVTDPSVDKNGDTWVALNQPSKSSRRDYFYAPVEHVRRQPQRNASFFDPGDPSVAMVRKGVSSSDMGAGQASAPSGGTPDASPAPPPSMSQGGPGAEAMPPMQQPQTIPNDSVSQHPFPNLPEGGGGGGGAPGMGQNPFMGGNPFMGSFNFQAETRNRPTSQDPTGVGGDEYDANTWDNVLQQNPRQSPEDRSVNTPQKANEPIRQNTSNGAERQQAEEED